MTVIVVAVLAIGIAVAAFAFLRGRTAVFPWSGRTSDLTASDRDAAEGYATGRVICGDRKCEPPEDVETCPIDCVDRDVFGGFTVFDSPDGDVVVAWMTLVPTTSVLDYRTSETGDFTRLFGSALTLDHEFTISGPESSGLDLSFRISGSDSDGAEHHFGVYGHER